MPEEHGQRQAEAVGEHRLSSGAGIAQVSVHLISL